jgi:hypothetical protein
VLVEVCGVWNWEKDEHLTNQIVNENIKSRHNQNSTIPPPFYHFKGISCRAASLTCWRGWLGSEGAWLKRNVTFSIVNLKMQTPKQKMAKSKPFPGFSATSNDN